MITKVALSTRYLLILSAACIMLSTIGLLGGCKTNKPEAGLIRSSGNSTLPSGRIPFPEPGSHDSGWLEYHSRQYDTNWSGISEQDNACYTCHYKADCIQCHNVTPPGDHTNTWRTLSHGFEAGGDRQRCLQCHKQDYCIRCHNETAPRSHRGNWSVNHCGQCHFDTDIAFGSGCITCHKAQHP